MSLKKSSWYWFGQDNEGKRKKKFKVIAESVAKSQGNLSASLIALTSEEPAAGPSSAQSEPLDWRPVAVCDILNTV